MNQASLIPSLQSDALAREVERQFKNEISAVIAAAERDADVIVAQARGGARRRMHEAIQALRREGTRRLVGANAKIETELRARAQRRAARAINDGALLLREELDARWRDPHDRMQWMRAVAQQCVLRLLPGTWLVEHPADWSEPEQRDFVAAIGKKNGVDVDFKATDDLKSGLRIKADQAVLDATPQGLLADERTVAAMILEEIEQR